MRLYRLCKARFATTGWDGEGARRVGGRWNHKGDAVVYTAPNVALAAWETFVHVDPGLIPNDLMQLAMTVPDDASKRELAARELPKGWSAHPAPTKLKDIGSTWLRSRETLLLLVPSAVIADERCVLVNPDHPEFARLRPEAPKPFAFDPRAWKR